MKNKLNKKSGFTLLEIIIVIIIVGILASLALPKFFSTVEYSRSTEALTSITTLRQSLERCYIQQTPSNYNDPDCAIGFLDIANPSNSATNRGPSFTYVISPASDSYSITATRVTPATGAVVASGGGTITVTQASNGLVTRAGTGAYVNIK